MHQGADEPQRRPWKLSTTSGATLPFFAVRHGQPLAVNEKNIPRIEGALSPGVHFKPLRLDLEAGCWVALAFMSTRRCNTTPTPRRSGVLSTTTRCHSKRRRELVPKYFDSEALVAVPGHREQTTELLKLPFGFIFVGNQCRG